MISKQQLKYYSSLLKKKFRKSENKFLVETGKIIKEGIESNYKCEQVYVTQSFFSNIKYLLPLLKKKNIPIEVIKETEMERLSDTQNPQGIIAVFKIPSSKPDIKTALSENTLIYLENISDPGNLGTIIRTCDWFGFNNILLSKDCAEIYNPKVVRSTAGSLFNLNIYKDIDFRDFFPAARLNNYKIFSADMEGLNIYEVKDFAKSIIIFSNEANGPSKEILKYADEKITIPRFGKAESLNVSAAAGIILSEIKRSQLFNR